MKLLSFHKLGQDKRETPRIWLESSRLTQNGFKPGACFQIQETARGITLLLEPTGKRNVSHRRAGGGTRPIIDVCNKTIGARFNGVPTVKANASFGRIDITPSIRGFLFKKNQQKKENFRTLELFAGGGTLSDATNENSTFQHVAGMEIEPNYADVWAQKNPNATLIQSDIRLVHPAEVPRFEVLVAGIPCTSHSTMGRAKKGLKGKPEEGDTGDLFLHVINLVSYHMPSACVFENVPSFGTSLAGNILKISLTHLGYHLEEKVFEPHSQWCEPSDRRRWCLVATLHPGFQIQIPNIPFYSNIEEYLDPEMDDLDQADANRIAKTITGLRAHNARHAALGHGFALTTLTRQSSKVPTIPKSYHKINTGPFLETKFGLRMLRLHEVEALMGAQAGTENYSVGIQILGQGVQTRIWKNVFNQLGEFLQNPEQTQYLTPVQVQDKMPEDIQTPKAETKLPKNDVQQLDFLKL